MGDYMYKMTSFQRYMLIWMGERRAVRIAGMVVTKQDIRSDERLAEQCYWVVS